MTISLIQNRRRELEMLTAIMNCVYRDGRSETHRAHSHEEMVSILGRAFSSGPGPSTVASITVTVVREPQSGYGVTVSGSVADENLHG